MNNMTRLPISSKIVTQENSAVIPTDISQLTEFFEILICIDRRRRKEASYAEKQNCKSTFTGRREGSPKKVLPHDG